MPFVLSMVGASSFRHAQPAPSITVDAAEYAPGATVNFTATGFVCNEVPVIVTLDPGGEIGSFPPADAFSGTFTAPSEPGTYELVADGQAAECIASTTFEVVVQPTTSEATTTTTTRPATTTSEVTKSTAEVTTTTADVGGTHRHDGRPAARDGLI